MNALTSLVATSAFANLGTSISKGIVTLSTTVQVFLVTVVKDVPSWKDPTPVTVIMVSCWTPVITEHVWTLMNVAQDNMTARGCNSASIALVALTVSVHLATSEIDSPAWTLMNVRQEITTAQIMVWNVRTRRADLNVTVQEGYAKGLTDELCADIDECAGNNGGCTHICENEIGSYICKGESGKQNNYGCENFFSTYYSILYSKLPIQNSIVLPKMELILLCNLCRVMICLLACLID